MRKKKIVIRNDKNNSKVNNRNKECGNNKMRKQNKQIQKLVTCLVSTIMRNTPSGSTLTTLNEMSKAKVIVGLYLT